MNEIFFPYLNHRISEESKECAIENILFHLMPYLVAKDDDELKKYKAMVSFDLMNSLVDEKDEALLFLKYRTKVIKKLKCNEKCFDIYKYEYEAYIANGGADAIIHGYTYRDMDEVLKKETPNLMMMYFFILTLLRLRKYAPQKFSIHKAKQIISNLFLSLNGREDFYQLWGITNTAKCISKYLPKGHIIFGYIHTLIQHNIINIQEMTAAKELLSDKVKETLLSYKEEKCYTLTSEIVGYALYARRMLEKFKHKQASESIKFLSMPDKAFKKFDFKVIEPVLEDFSGKERQKYIDRDSNSHTVRHLKAEPNL